jgi:cullin-associated NEDD8-dissociated protein 1
LILLGDSALGIAVDVLPSGPLNKLFRIEKADSDKIKSLIVKVNGETTEMSSLNAELWSQSLVDAKHKTEKYIEMLSGVDDSQIIPKSIVGKRLNTVSKMIKVRSQRGITKDFFFLEDNSYDHHFEGKTKLNPKLDALDAALNGFRQEMKSISMWHKTTVVVVTEFGRTVSQNSGGGTDHAWLGHALLLGGGIKGGVIHGKHPSSYRSEDDHNIGRGLLIPKVPFEALWSGIAQHVGVDDIDMEYVLPKKASFGCELLSEKDLYKEGKDCFV